MLACVRFRKAPGLTTSSISLCIAFLMCTYRWFFLVRVCRCFFHFIQHQPSNRFHSLFFFLWSIQFERHTIIFTSLFESEQILCHYMRLSYRSKYLVCVGDFQLLFDVLQSSLPWCLPLFFLRFYLPYFIHVGKVLELHTMDFVIWVDKRKMH